jgi:hypothetical protein
MNVEKVDGRPARHSGDRPALQSVRFLEVFLERVFPLQVFFGSFVHAALMASETKRYIDIQDLRYTIQGTGWVGAGGSLGPAHNAQSGVGLSAQINPAYYQEHMRDVIHFRVEAQAVAWAGYKAPIKGSHEGL